MLRGQFLPPFREIVGHSRSMPILFPLRPVLTAFAHGLVHRQHVLDRNASLDIMSCIEDKSPASAEDLQTLANLGPNLLRRSKGQRALRVNAAAPKGDLRTELLF